MENEKNIIKEKKSQKIKLLTCIDTNWEKYWKQIEKAKDFIFIITYDFDNKQIANTTMLKLISALERDIPVCLMVEHLNVYIDKPLLKEFRSKGGVLITPNRLEKSGEYIIEGQLHKFFNRSHQKVTLIDENLFIGSLNIADEYSGIKYGSNKFVDNNLFIKKTVQLKKILYFFREICDEEIGQFRTLSSKEAIYSIFDKYGIKEKMDFSNTFTDDNFEQFLEEKLPYKSEIQDEIYKRLDEAKESITIIQAYYTNLDRIEYILKNAVKKGVKVEIITAEKRDQIAYKYQYNSDIFRELIKNGVDVYEYLDKYLHIKAYYIDRKYLNTGSLNNDLTSFNLNNEANYSIIRNPNHEKVFRDFEENIEKLKENCRIVPVYRERIFTRYVYGIFWNYFIKAMELSVSNRESRFLLNFDLKKNRFKRENEK
jgi:cardiolipin synthase